MKLIKQPLEEENIYKFFLQPQKSKIGPKNRNLGDWPLSNITIRRLLGSVIISYFLRQIFQICKIIKKVSISIIRNTK